jgi:hypothetical protein
MNTVSEPLRKGLSVAYRGIAYLLLGATIPATLAFADDQPDRARGEGQDATVRSTNTPSNSDDSNATRSSGSAATQQPSSEALPTAVESSLFTSLFMSGKTQEQFEPLTPKERLAVYAKDLFGPFHLLLAGVSAGVTQLQDSPKEWGEGAQGFGIRYANYYGIALIGSVLQMGGEDLLHEDNLYYGSGEHGLWRRMKYAVKSSVLARSADGTQHFSVSQVGSTAAASFISRIWQPRSSDSAADGAKNFGISMATNAGINVVREFLPDVTRHVFHKGEAR